MPATGDRRAGPRVLFMGTPGIAVPSLEALIEHFTVVAVATQPDRRSGRGRRLEPSPVKMRALEAGIPVLQPSGLKSAEAVQEIAATRPDVIAVVAYGLILPAGVLEIPPLGCVNVHTSLLPRHRGASPIHAAILAGDPITGVTTMLMDRGLDTGPVLLQEEVVVRAHDTTPTLGERLAGVGADLLVRTITELVAGTLAPRPQDHEAATVTGLIRKADGRIDWREPADRVERQVRAMQPWPSAYTFHDGTRLQIWRAESVPDPGVPGVEPGTVVAVDDGVCVACGMATILRVRELQRPGGRRLSAADFLRGFELRPGDRLDDEGGQPAPARRTGG